MGCKMNDKENKFLLAEYAALSNFFTQIINFRFITFGFFITAVGFIFTQTNSDHNNNLPFFFLLVLTFIVFIIEMRNRTLSSTIIERCKQIEKKFIDTDDVKLKPFFNLINTKNHSIILGIKPEFWKQELCNLKFSCNNKELFFYSHTFAIDFAYTVCFIFCLLKIFVFKE